MRAVQRRRRIITLTSTPPRFGTLDAVFAALARQQLAPDRVELWIPARYRRYPGWTGQLPNVPPGVQLMRCPVDHGPATKILPALDHYADQDVDLILCDDDHLYHPDWLANLDQAAGRNPMAAIAGAGFDWQTANQAGPQPRCILTTTAERKVSRDTPQARHFGRAPMVRHSGFCDVFHGFCGVLLRPDMLAQPLSPAPDVLWAVDDPWLSGHLERSGTRIWVDADVPPPLVVAQADAIEPLTKAVLYGHDRAAANREALLYFQTHHHIWQAGHR